jgi:hypothetical protein
MLTGCAKDGVVPPPAARIPAAAPVKASQRINEWSENWTALFDGKTLTNWAVTDFGGHGPITVGGGDIKIGAGAELSGITWTNGSLPKTDYEISLEAERTDGGDFFCGLTFPVVDSSCSLIVGGWGGGIVGLSSLDEEDASENETTRNIELVQDHWYKIVLRVTPDKIETWLDGKNVIDVPLAGKKVSLRPGSIYLSAPLGIATYETSAAIRDFKLRLIEH